MVQVRCAHPRADVCYAAIRCHLMTVARAWLAAQVLAGASAGPLTRVRRRRPSGPLHACIPRRMS